MRATRRKPPLETLIVAVPETAGSALYGMVDVLSATGSIWPTLMRSGETSAPFRVRIVAPRDARSGAATAFPSLPSLPSATTRARTS